MITKRPLNVQGRTRDEDAAILGLGMEFQVEALLCEVDRAGTGDPVSDVSSTRTSAVATPSAR